MQAHCTRAVSSAPFACFLRLVLLSSWSVLYTHTLGQTRNSSRFSHAHATHALHQHHAHEHTLTAGGMIGSSDEHPPAPRTRRGCSFEQTWRFLVLLFFLVLIHSYSLVSCYLLHHSLSHHVVHFVFRRRRHFFVVCALVTSLSQRFCHHTPFRWPFVTSEKGRGKGRGACVGVCMRGCVWGCGVLQLFLFSAPSTISSCLSEFFFFTRCV